MASSHEEPAERDAVAARVGRLLAADRLADALDDGPCEAGE